MGEIGQGRKQFFPGRSGLAEIRACRDRVGNAGHGPGARGKKKAQVFACASGYQSQPGFP